jgi:HSP20 family protein
MTQLKSTKNVDLFPEFVTDFFNSDRFFSPARCFGKEFEDFFPAVNIKESDKQFNIELAVPGFSKEDFKISMDGDVLNISAQKKSETEKKEEKYTRKEYSYNSFSRSFTMPANANAEAIDARYENGILMLDIAKKELPGNPNKKEIAIK